MTGFNPGDLVYIAPLLILAATGMMLVLAEAFFRGRDHSTLMALAVAGSVAAAVASIVLYRQIAPGSVRPLLGTMLLADRFGYVLTALVSATTALAAMVAPGHQRTHGWRSGELYGLMLLSAFGMGILAQAGDLATVFLGIETMSIAVYVMCAMRRRSRRGNEAAMKYFLMGAFATGFLLYGIALVYGAAGTTSLITIAGGEAKPMSTFLTTSPYPGVAVAGVFLLVVAFGFKVAAVPFHMWAPDAYEGAPTPVTAFMAAAVKVAAVAGAIRVFGHGLGGDVLPFGHLGWASPMVVIAAVTITVGNIAAIRQDNVKRMLAYSSISHGGVILAGLAAMGLGAASGQAALVYYLIAYSVTTMGAFAVVAYVGSRDRERLTIADWAGLGARHPGAALAMTICLLSLGGMPPTGGFFAKFYIFQAAMDVSDQQLLWLVVIGVVNTVISIFYYLRIVTAMYFRDAKEDIVTVKSAALAFVIVICPLVILEMGLLPGFWLKLGM
jgi:NADH-quinone oxidoreductase subunit N